MNVSFFLKPKAEVVYVYDTDTVSCALKRMAESGFTALPVITQKGRYVGTITEGDFLRLLLEHPLEQAENMPLSEVNRRVHHRSCAIDAHMEDLVELVSDQNFVPVMDGRGTLCGIVTRRDVIRQLSESYKQVSEQLKQTEKKY